MIETEIGKMKATFFESAAAFRRWLEKSHKKEDELIVGYYKINTGKPSMTWSESVDQALCFGWIDGIRRKIDDESYCIRFTPRRPRSNWSAVNICKMEDLIEKGLMTPAGLAVYQLREEEKSRIYAYEKREVRFSPEYRRLFTANRDAWKYFQSMPKSYRKPATNWVMSAKREETRLKRLHTLIADSEAGRKIKPLSYGRGKNQN